MKKALTLLMLAAILALSACTSKHQKALNYLEQGDYDTGYQLLLELGEEEEVNEHKYSRAVQCLADGEYENAYILLDELGKAEEITANKRSRAEELLLAEDYENAYELFEEIGEEAQITNSKRDRAETFLLDKNYNSAYALFEEIGETEEIKKSKKERALQHLDNNENQAGLSLLKEIGEYDYGLEEIVRKYIIKHNDNDCSEIFEPFGEYYSCFDQSSTRDSIGCFFLASKTNHSIGVAHIIIFDDASSPTVMIYSGDGNFSVNHRFLWRYNSKFTIKSSEYNESLDSSLLPIYNYSGDSDLKETAQGGAKLLIWCFESLVERCGLSMSDFGFNENNL